MKNKEATLNIGEIFREHGIHGEVKVYLYSGNAENFRKDMQVWLERTGGNLMEVKVQKVEPYQRWFLTRLSLFNHPEEAKLWRKAKIYIKKSDLRANSSSWDSHPPSGPIHAPTRLDRMVRDSASSE